MKKRFYYLFLFFFTLSLTPGVFAQPEVTPALQDVLSEKAEEEFISVNMRFEAQIDDQQLYQQSRTIRDREKRRRFVVDELKAFSEQHQAGLLSWLEDMQAAGKAKNIRPLWVANLVNAEVKPSVVQELMARKDLDRLDYNQMRKVLMSDQELSAAPKALQDKTKDINLAWNVTLVNADQVWDQGFTGEDVIVAVMDTGINYNHLDITDNMWIHPDYPGFGYNFVNNNHNTMDQQGHGTHCAGTVAGTGAAGTGTGIAPGATIMNLQVLSSSGSGSEAGVWAGIQFAIDYGAHIMSLSLGWQHAWGPDRSTWRVTMNNALSAGLIAAVASGNEGGWGGQPPPSEVRTPGDVPPPWLHPDQTLQGGVSAVVSVGSTTSTDNLSGFSSKGPVTWQNVAPFNDYEYSPGMGLIRPDVTAPGSDVLSLLHSNNTGYTTKSGTSMATPAVAGVMALMLSKNPNLTPEEISQILEESAIEMTSGKSNTFGSGRVDALAAVNATPYMGIRYVDHEVDDSEGNDNGNINPGELIKLNITLENPTEEGIDDVMVELSFDSPYLTMIDSTASFGDFEAGEIKTLEEAFSFEVAHNIPGSYDISFSLNAYAVENVEDVWTSSFKEMAHAPLLEFSNLMVVNGEDDDKGNNGILFPGETATIQVTLTNTGQMETEDVHAYIESDGEWITILTYEGVEFPPIEAGDSVEASFMVNAFHDTPLETLVELDFKALTGPYEFLQTKEIVIGEAPYYSGGDIPSTYNTSPNTGSSAIEPGEMTVSIPEDATITGVDVEYKITSQGGAWVSEQRSFLRCVSDGGETESQVYSGGSANSGGTIEYERSGLTIANDVEGGGDIEFELHVFRTWGGSGSNTQYAYVPNNTWKVIVHYTMPAYDVTFRVENQFEEQLEGALVKVGNTTVETDEDGEAFFELPEGNLYYTVTAENHRALMVQPLEVLPEENLVDVQMTRVFEAEFMVTDIYGDEVPDAVITFEDETLEPGQYLVDDLEDGIYNFSVELEGYLTYEGELEIIDSDVEVEVVMTPIFNLTFIIHDQWGYEVHDAVITINGETHAEGEYEVGDIVPGTHSFTVSADYYHDYTGEVEVTDQDKEVEVILNADGTSVDELTAEQVNIYPNPASNLVNLEFYNESNQNAIISLINYTGQVVKAVDAGAAQGQISLELNLSGLNPGVYFLRIDNGQVSTHKLVVQ